MNHDYQQALASMSVEDVSCILSLLSPPSSSVASSNSAAGIVVQQDEDEDGRRRRRIERDWPEMGTILTADYFGTTYTAEIIPATKRLKSGKQIRIESGPAKGAVCDSFSEAMIEATEAQRTVQNLGRKGVSNGWVFWQWDGKPSNINGEEEINDLE